MTLSCANVSYDRQGMRGLWAVYYTIAQRFMIMFVIRWVNKLGLLLNFNLLFHKVVCPNVSITNS